MSAPSNAPTLPIADLIQTLTEMKKNIQLMRDKKLESIQKTVIDSKNAMETSKKAVLDAKKNMITNDEFSRLKDEINGFFMEKHILSNADLEKKLKEFLQTKLPTQSNVTIDEQKIRQIVSDIASGWNNALNDKNAEEISKQVINKIVELDTKKDQGMRNLEARLQFIQGKLDHIMNLNMFLMSNLQFRDRETFNDKWD